MPHDAAGNRADIAIYGGSRIKRMNLGSLIEQFVNAARRDLTHRLRREAGFLPDVPPTEYQIQEASKNHALVEQQWSTLMAYFEIFLPLQYEMLINDPGHARFVASVWRDGIYHYWPPNNPVNTMDAMRELRASEFCPIHTPVTYRGPDGRMVTTKKPVLIGSLYFILLEKIGEDWSSVASVKTNHFGIPAKLNNHDKRSALGRQQSNRGIGESESRSYIATVGPEATMELMDQSNNPQTHRNVVENILESRHPSNIVRVVNRKKVPFGGSRPVLFARHILACQGLEFHYTPKLPEND